MSRHRLNEIGNEVYGIGGFGLKPSKETFSEAMELIKGYINSFNISSIDELLETINLPHNNVKYLVLLSLDIRLLADSNKELNDRLNAACPDMETYDVSLINPAWFYQVETPLYIKQRIYTNIGLDADNNHINLINSFINRCLSRFDR